MSLENAHTRCRRRHAQRHGSQYRWCWLYCHGIENGEIPGVCRGQRTWHVQREALENLGDPIGFHIFVRVWVHLYNNKGGRRITDGESDIFIVLRGRASRLHVDFTKRVARGRDMLRHAACKGTSPLRVCGNLLKRGRHHQSSERLGENDANLTAWDSRSGETGQ